MNAGKNYDEDPRGQYKPAASVKTMLTIIGVSSLFLIVVIMVGL